MGEGVAEARAGRAVYGVRARSALAVDDRPDRVEQVVETRGRLEPLAIDEEGRRAVDAAADAALEIGLHALQFRAALHRLAQVGPRQLERLRDAPVPINDDLSAFHRQLRRTADRVISASSDDKRRYYFARLLDELDIDQQKLQHWEASPQVTEPVRRLVEMLHKYQHVLTNS